MKHKRSTPAVTTRTLPPLTEKKDGRNVLTCPFCVPSHPIRHDAVSPCGTILQVRAVQTVIRAKYEKDMVCVRCGQGGGEMVRYQNAFIHAHDCAPGKLVFTEPPRFSSLAKFIFKWPGRMKNPIEALIGQAQPVKEVDLKGQPTGKTLGYIFWKEQTEG